MVHQMNTASSPHPVGFISLQLTLLSAYVISGTSENRARLLRADTHENNLSLTSDLSPLLETSKRVEQAGNIPGWVAAIYEWH